MSAVKISSRPIWTGTYSIPLFALAAFAAVGACVSLLLNEKRGARAA